MGNLQSLDSPRPPEVEAAGEPTRLSDEISPKSKDAQALFGAAYAHVDYHVSAGDILAEPSLVSVDWS